jgi:2'-hydroxyisoflavone reductase
MRILVLGGTVFLGRAIVEAALARGHELTLFNRGRSNPGLYPEVEHLAGDRSGDLAALTCRQWDAVVDTSGYVPGVVARSAQALAPTAEHYTFISTISAYRDFSRSGMDESAPLATLIDPTVTEVTGETYGPLKALCEQFVKEAFPGHNLIIRPGLIAGPHDPTDRFTYWPVRIAAGGDVLAPGNPARQVQYIDVRDLAAWIVRLVEARQDGVYNATGPAEPLTMAGLLYACVAASGRAVDLTWAGDEFLLAEGVEPWVGLPLWLPETDPSLAGLLSVDISAALAAGLTCRPPVETARDTLVWAGTRPADHTWAAGISTEREAALLAAWSVRTV